MASFSDKATGPIKAKRLSLAEEESMAGLFTAEKTGMKTIENDRKYSGEVKQLNKKYPDEAKNLIFGTPSNEYIAELFELKRKYEKTEAENLEDFKSQF